MTQQTVRQRIASMLRQNALTGRDISEAAGIPEKDVAAHLDHIRQSLRAVGERLSMTPPECLSCGFRFAERRRLTRPGKCPRCRATRIAPPLFRIHPS
jgi:predicted Zn-ribbon and HTH transcriptional regulator